MGTTTVYLDVIFLDNILMDFFILHLSTRLSKTETKMIRVLLGACVGAFYAIGVVLMKCNWLTNVICKLLVCFMMVLVVGMKQSISRLLKLYGWVIVISLFCGGMLFFIMYLDPSSINTTSGVISFLNKQLKVKLYGVIASYFVLNWFFDHVFQMKKMEHTSVTMCVRMNEKDYQFIGLADSGNQLMHPQIKCPLPIIYIKALEIIPSDECITNEYELIQKVAEIVENSKEPQKFFTVSYKTISHQHAMMPGIFVTKLIIMKNDKKLFEAEQYPVALTMNEIQSYETCGGIVPTQLLEAVV